MKLIKEIIFLYLSGVSGLCFYFHVVRFQTNPKFNKQANYVYIKRT